MIRKILDKVESGWLFLLIVFIIYIFLAIGNYALAEKSVLAFARLFINIVPVLVLVFVIMLIFNLFLDNKRLIRYLGKGSGVKGWLLSIGGGILSTGPIYMWYPLLSDLKEKGMKNSLIAAFIYNRAVKIPLLPIMIYYFGIAFTVILTVYMIIFSVINGLIVGKIVKR